MIERLFPEEWNFGGGKRREMERETVKIKEALSGKLDPEGRELLEQLSTSFIRSSNLEIQDAFAQGFWTALDLIMEYQQWRKSDS